MNMHPRSALPLTLLVSAIAIVAALGAARSPAGTSQSRAVRSAAACNRGSVAVRIGGKRVCLHAGLHCKKRYERQYKKHGFHCQAGRLRKVRKHHNPPPPPPQPPPVPPAGTIAATVAVGHSLGPITTGEGAVWVENRDGTVSRIDPATNTVVATITLPFELGNSASGWIVTGNGSVWVSNYGVNTVTRIDAATNKVVATISVGDAPTGLAVTPGAIWVANHLGRSLSKINPATNAVTTIPVGDQTGPIDPVRDPQELAVAGGSLWFEAQELSGRVIEHLDPATNVVSPTRIPVVGFCELSADSASLWAACLDERKLYPVTLAASTFGTSIEPPFAPFTLAVGLGAIWAVDLGSRGLVRLDPTTGALRQTKLAATGGLAIGFGAVWVGRSDKTILRITP